MYIKVQKLPLFKPNIKLSNTEILFITDECDNFVFDDRLIQSGADFIYDNVYAPYLIVELFGEVELHHHFIQEPNGNKKFPPLKWVGSEWVSDKYNSILHVANICKIRNELDLEHLYINLFETASKGYGSYLNHIFDSECCIDLNNQILLAQEADRYFLAKNKLEELKRNQPYTRSGNHIKTGILKFMYDNKKPGYENIIKTDNDIIINNALKSIPGRPGLSILMDYLDKKNEKELSSNDLNNILKRFSEKEITEPVRKESNTVTKDDLVVAEDATINVSNITNVLSSINSLNFMIEYVKDKETGDFELSKISAAVYNREGDDNLIDITKTVRSSNLPTYITNLLLVFRFASKVVKVEIHKMQGIISIVFELDTGETKDITFNLISSIITTSSLCLN